MHIYRVNFFEPELKPIRCLAHDSSISRLAVLRADSSIEIWDVVKNPFLEKIIPHSSDNSITAVTWCNGRLFSADMHGYISEHDLTELIPKYQLIVTSGSPIWCMNFNKQKTCLAIGNEDGHVVLHDLSPNGLDFQKKFDKQQGGIMCLAWHKDGQVIVTGSEDTIRMWNVETGHVINRIILSRAMGNIPTIVWCITVLSDMTIVSGDSCGKTSFWDGNFGTLQSAVSVHKGDVLALCLNEEEDNVYSTGVDPIIICHSKSSPDGKWLKSVQRIVHTHDVRALLLIGDFLVSGGDDCNLAFTKYPPKTTIKCFPFCQMPYASVAPDAPFLLLRYSNHIDVWEISAHTTSTTAVSPPRCMVQVHAKENEAIICSAISADGKWLAYSTQFQMRLFALNMEAISSCPMHKISLPDEFPCVATIMLFTLNPAKLIFYVKNEFYIIECVIHQPKLIANFEEHPDSAGQTHIMELSPNNLYLASGSHNGNVVIHCLETQKILCKLPHYTYQPTALKFDPASENLIVVYSDRKVIEYSIKKEAYTKWSKQRMLLNFQKSSYHPITSIVFNSNKLLFQDENHIYRFNRDEKEPAKKRLKRSEVTSREEEFMTIKEFEHISSIHLYANGLLIVQISSNHILNCLSAPMWKKKYGT